MSHSKSLSASIAGHNDKYRHAQGMALVIILGIIVLIFAMAVAFLGSISTERTASSNYAVGISTRQLGDIAVNLAQAQIQHATTQVSGGAPLAWASQPGMVRTFNADGSLNTAYKLYSDAAMTTDSIDPPAIANDLNGWKEGAASFTDLNAPVSVTRKIGGSSTNQLVYPILDPVGIGVSGGKSPVIDGFAVNSAPSATATQPAPMPVRWLYVLQDGTLASGSGTGLQTTVSAATKENPIVGRIAFWTDDESSKLNINTAAHGTRWDIPRVMAADDALPFVRFQPTIREFQRYPGHPAMTSLAPVLGHLYGVQPTESDPYISFLGQQAERDFANFVYGIIPRVEGGGSNFGQTTVTSVKNPVVLDSDRLYASVDELIFAPDRKAQKSSDGASIDRQTMEGAKFFLTAQSRSPEVNLYQKPRISMWPINNGENGKIPSSIDKLLAFCSTINGVPYYVQRADPDIPNADIGIAENKSLLEYLRGLLASPFPGFGTTSFTTKYGANESNQITTEILDYIRSSNIMSVTDYGATKFSTDVEDLNHESTTSVGTRGGQVSPMIPDGENTKGFGRIPTISRAVLQFYISDIVDKPPATTPPTPVRSLIDPSLRHLAASGSDPAAYVPRTANTPLVRFPVTDTDPTDTVVPAPKKDDPYDIETKAVLYFDFFDAMAGYPVSNYNFDLIVEFSGPWTVTPDPATGQASQTLGFSNIQSTFPGGVVRIPMRYNGYHGYDFNLLAPPANPRMGGINYGYRLGGGRAIVANLMGFLGFDRSYRDQVNNVTGANGGDGVTDYFPLVSNPLRLHRSMGLVEDATMPQGVRFADAPNLLPSTNVPANSGSIGFHDTFRFDGGTVIVKLVVNEKGGADTSMDHVIQTFSFEFPAVSKFVPAYAATTTSNTYEMSSNVLQPGSKFNNQRRQMGVDANFSYRPRGTPVNFLPLGKSSGAGTVTDQSATHLTQPGDIILSLETAYGDPRLTSGKKSLTTDTNYMGGKASGDFAPHEDYFKSSSPTDIKSRHAYSFRVGGENYSNVGSTFGAHGGLSHPEFGRFIGGMDYGRNAMPNLPSRWRNGVPVFELDGTTGTFLPDFDTGLGYMQDGPYLNRADEGAVTAVTTTSWPWAGSAMISGGDQSPFYSPNKQMTGAGMLGSLPTGVISGNPWQTLLFRPDPTKEHPGSETPPDYLLLDMFWMPVVEPYAISEPLSTAGKINLNHQIFPFTYIKRDTALRGLLLKEEIPAVLNNSLGSGTSDSYKKISALDASALTATYQSRNRIDLNETIKAIDERFKNGDIYRSEAEICTVPLIPIGQTFSADFAYDSSWWKARTATGDNMKERPYTNLVTRLTTKSNIYTVHYRVQTLAKPPGTAPSVWTEGKDPVLGEYRGSTTIERYINPNIHETAWTSAAETPNLGGFYQWRTLNTIQFSP